MAADMAWCLPGAEPPQHGVPGLGRILGAVVISALERPSGLVLVLWTKGLCGQSLCVWPGLPSCHGAQVVLGYSPVPGGTM
jgi:hypothetical protein